MTFPKDNWETVPPDEAGLDPDHLNKVKVWLDERVADRKYRFAIVRGGKLVVEWNHRVERDEKLAIASTWKSMLSNVLGIAVAEGKLPSVDAAIYDYWPEYMDVPEGTGPKDGRYAFPKDRRITFRQLISNTSGYMKPGEEPGTVFHYQSWGMNILSHAVAHLYGYYDAQDPEKSDGCLRLMWEKLAEPLGAGMGVLIGHHGAAPLGATEYFRLWHEYLDYCARLGSRRVAVVQLRPLGGCTTRAGSVDARFDSGRAAYQGALPRK